MLPFTLQITIYTSLAATNFLPTLVYAISFSLSESISSSKKMLSFDNLHDLPEQICYVKCCFCNTILLVGVPYSSLAMVVTIRCGHCNNIFSLNLMKACLHLSSSLNLHSDHQMPKLEVCNEEVIADKKATTACYLSLGESSDEEENDQDSIQFNQVILKPPEKKQRAPTKYNHFIKEEIKRLKIEHPNMTHKQAFSAASKNWAHCPQSEYKQEEVHGCDEGDRNTVTHSTIDDEVHCLGNAFHETKALMQSVCTTTPFY